MFHSAPHFFCTQTRYTWESLTNHVLVTLFIIFCFDMAFGELLWRKSLLSEKGNFSSASYYNWHPAERTFAADRMKLKTLTHRWHCLRRKGNVTTLWNPSVSAYIFNYLQLCVKNVFKTVLGNTLPRNDRQMKVLGGFWIVKYGKKGKKKQTFMKPVSDSMFC